MATMTDYDRRQFEQAAIDDPEAAQLAQTEALKADLHTSLPGKVVSFNAGKQTAIVRPGIQRYFRGQGWQKVPDLMDVPVQFPRGGGFVLTFPVAAGDECLIVFSERAIDTWLASGGEQVPHEYRTHDLSDACAIMGISSSPHTVGSFSTDAVELRSLDGSAKVQIDGGGNIAIQSTGGNVTVKSGGFINLNGPDAPKPGVDNLLTGSLMCPVLKATHGSFAVSAGGTGMCLKVVGG